MLTSLSLLPLGALALYLSRPYTATDDNIQASRVFLSRHVYHSIFTTTPISLAPLLRQPTTRAPFHTCLQLIGY